MKKKLKYIFIVVAIVLVAIIILVTRPTSELQYDLGYVQKSDVQQEVSVTGKIVSVEQRDLSFERPGKVITVYAEVGDEVSTGDALVALDDRELEAQLQQAQANLDVSKIVLQELINGTREEEIQIAETAVENAKRNLDSTQVNRDTVTEKSKADITKIYDGTVTTIQSVMIDIKNTLITIADIQGAHFNSFDQQSANLAAIKATIVQRLFGVESSGYWEAEFLSSLNDGLFGTVQSLDGNKDTNQIDIALNETKNILLLLRDTLDSVPIISEMTTTEKTSLTGAKTIIASDITKVSDKQQSISVQNILNTNSIDISEASVTNAKNILLQAEDQLALKQSGNTDEQIGAQKARIRAQEASVQLFNVQMTKLTLRTPIDGILTKQDAEVGVVVSPGSLIVSVTSSGLYEIETYIPEADITKVSLGDRAVISLDAYTDDTKLIADVVSIDQSETVIQGVSTYKVILMITEGAEFVRSGMTANITIQTAIKEMVLNIPTRAIGTEGNIKFVRIMNANNEVIKIPITIGLRSSDGRTEILEGLSEKQEIITFISQ